MISLKSGSFSRLSLGVSCSGSSCWWILPGRFYAWPSRPWRWFSSKSSDSHRTLVAFVSLPPVLHPWSTSLLPWSKKLSCPLDSLANQRQDHSLPAITASYFVPLGCFTWNRTTLSGPWSIYCLPCYFKLFFGYQPALFPIWVVNIFLFHYTIERGCFVWPLLCLIHVTSCCTASAIFHVCICSRFLSTGITLCLMYLISSCRLTPTNLPLNTFNDTLFIQLGCNARSILRSLTASVMWAIKKLRQSSKK